MHEHFFDTLTVRVPGRAAEVLAAAAEQRINLRSVDADTLGIALDETTTPAIVAAVLDSVRRRRLRRQPATTTDAIPPALQRTSEFLTHPAFTSHRSEHQMLRYLRRLADRDLALDRTMIPLGSCTMKLNATAEMEPITWPEFGRMHPVRADRPGTRLPRAVRRSRTLARGDHGLRRGVAAAERGFAG